MLHYGVFLLSCVHFLLTVNGQDLYFSIARTPGLQYCGHLFCWNIHTESQNLLTTESLTIYDISAGQGKAKLASVGINSGLYVDESKSNDVSANGMITDVFANLTLELSSDVYCLHRTFLCELTFQNFRRKIVVINKTIAPKKQDSGSEASPELSWLVKSAQKELAELKQKVEALEEKNAVLEDRNNRLEEKNARLEATVQRLSHHVSFPGGPQIPQPPTPGQPQQPQQPQEPEVSFEQEIRCYKGLQSRNSREKITLFDNIQTLCDTQTDGGGWIVIQRRIKGDVNFYLSWNEYKKGFGSPDGDFWIGNDVIHKLSSMGLHELRIDIDQNGQKHYGHYNYVGVGDEASGYALTVSGFTGTIADSLSSRQNGTKFSTFDRDNDQDALNCAQFYLSAWWYRTCYNILCAGGHPAMSIFSECQDVSLNGVWRTNGVLNNWWANEIAGFITPEVKITEIKIRRSNAIE